jgi:hypothetical protein
MRNLLAVSDLDKCRYCGNYFHSFLGMFVLSSVGQYIMGTFAVLERFSIETGEENCAFMEMFKQVII